MISQCTGRTDSGNQLQSASDEVELERMEWFREAKFGLFLHWGLYSISEGEWGGDTTLAEWLMIKADIPSSEYEKLAKKFNPVDFNAREWVRVAKAAGMRYIVITAKHHDGFCMYDSKYTEYDILDATPYGKDPMKELAKACREGGIKLCFYYSIADWHHPELHQKYNQRKFHPAGFHGNPNPNADIRKYAEYMKNQTQELLSNYGDVGIIWYDAGGAFRGDDMAKLLDTESIIKMIREMQPGCLINDRLAGPGTDYGTPEQHIPEGVQAKPFEVCMTLGRKWSWSKYDVDWKTPAQVIFNLVDITSKGGNYLLGIGPKPDGSLPTPATEILPQVGKWLDEYGESVYNAGAIRDQLRFREGIATQGDDKIYLHFFKEIGKETITLEGYFHDHKKIYMLDPSGNKEIKTEKYHGALVLHLPKKLNPNPDRIIVIEY